MIERQIISSVYSEEMYQDVQFLEPNDFTNPLYRHLWKLIQESEGDTLKVLLSIDNPTQVQYHDEVRRAMAGVSMARVGQMGLYLVERRFKTLFTILFEDLMSKTKSDVEKSMIVEVWKSIEKEDIFILSDNVLAYLGDHATKYTTERINAFISYRTKRINDIKNKTYGIK